MEEAISAEQPLATPAPATESETTLDLLRELVRLWLPVLTEHVLHLCVGLVSTYLANHLPNDAAAAAAAVGTMAYIIWFMGLIVSAIGTGSMALIARARGARHRSLANGVCGQSATAAMTLGTCIGLVFLMLGPYIVDLTNLQGKAHDFALTYVRLLSFALPFSTFMFVANACLRGAGDTVRPAICMVTVELINLAVAFTLTQGFLGVPALGFKGIALGTAASYIVGGLMQFVVLVRGRGGVRLHLHRMRPHWLTLKRVFRIGIPSGTEGLLTWAANFAIVIVINRLDKTNVMPAAHNNAIRLEAISFMVGFAAAIAAAAMVGQSLGMKRPDRARKSAYLGYAVGGGFMTLCGLIFILFGGAMSRMLATDPRIAELTRQCLFITGFVQCGFAASIVFSGALRGAGDTMAVMLINLASIIGIRFVGVMFVGWYFGTLASIWVVLCVELMCRGIFMYGRFLHGGWSRVSV